MKNRKEIIIALKIIVSVITAVLGMMNSDIIETSEEDKE